MFDSIGLGEALRDKWLYFVGDSSTRGLVLALFYELTDAKHSLEKSAHNKTHEKTHSNEAGFLRSMSLFNYGSAESRSQCKQTLVDLKRGFRHSLDDCDDFGDPCSPMPEESLVGEVDVNVDTQTSTQLFVGDSVRVTQDKWDEVDEVFAKLTGEVDEVSEESPPKIRVVFAPEGGKRQKVVLPAHFLEIVSV